MPAPMLRGALLCVLVCGSVAFSTTPHPLVRPHLPRHAATPLHRPASAMQQFATAAASAWTSPQAVVDSLRAPLTPIDRVESGLLAGDCAKLSGTVPWGRSSRPRVSRKNRATCFMRMNERAERLHALTELALITEICRLGNVSDDGLLARLKHRFPDEYAKYGAENFNETTTVLEAQAEAKCLSRPYRGSGPFDVIRWCLLRPVRLLGAICGWGRLVSAGLGALAFVVKALLTRRRVPAEYAGYQQQLFPPRVSRAGTCALRSPVCTQFSSVYPLFHVVAAARSALGWYSPTHCRCSGDLDSRVCDGGVIFRKLSEGQGGRRREPRAARVYQGKSPKPPQRN